MITAKPFWKSRIFWLNAFAIALALLGVFQASPLFEDVKTQQGLALLLAVLNIGLRFLTDQPITTRSEPKHRRHRT